jgi:4-hydroxy-3-methylbut-2-enyl diphosphate reductase
LAELADAQGVPARLIDGPDDVDLGWFSGDETVLMTAGASAPEDVVQNCLALLEKEFGATIENRAIREEEIAFRPPKELRELSWRRSQTKP